MPLSGLKRIVLGFFKFTIARPLQRFNIENRMLKYLGPDSKYFKPSPRAGDKYYQQLEKPQLGDDKFVIAASNKLEVTKTVVKVDSDQIPSTRPLPTSTRLQLQDIRSIWVADKIPPGRLSLDMLQEIMLNKLADENYWTPDRVAERYQIKSEYAENLLNHLKQIRIVISPHMKKLLDYTAKDDPVYQQAKHLVYIVDKDLRNDIDKQYDKMFLPEDELNEEVRSLIEPAPSHKQLDSAMSAYSRLVKKVEPLRLEPLNKPEPKEQLEPVNKLTSA